MKKIVDWKIVDDPREEEQYAICFVFLYDDFTWAYSNFSLIDVNTHDDECLDRIQYSLKELADYIRKGGIRYVYENQM